MIAKFDSKCRSCSTPISAGRTVIARRADGVWVCGACKDRPAFYTPDLAPKPVDANLPPAPVKSIPNVSAIRELLYSAKRHLKSPRIEIAINGLALVFYVAGDRSRHAGKIMVVGPRDRSGFFATKGPWYGTIADTFVPQRDCTDAVVAALTEFAADPAGTAAKYGQISGRCCFCRLELTDEKSTAVGYGPRCAKNFGLPYGKKAAAAIASADGQAAVNLGAVEARFDDDYEPRIPVAGGTAYA